MNFIIELAWGFSTVIGKIKIYFKERQLKYYCIVVNVFQNFVFTIRQITHLGILLFLVEIAILCWVKFWFKDHTVAWVATGLLIPILVIFVGFAAHFYLKLVAHKSEVSNYSKNN